MPGVHDWSIIDHVLYTDAVANRLVDVAEVNKVGCVADIKVTKSDEVPLALIKSGALVGLKKTRPQRIAARPLQRL